MNRQAKRLKALQTLRETGMTDAEIEEQLGRSITELLGQASQTSDDVIDVEVVEIDGEPVAADQDSQPDQCSAVPMVKPPPTKWSEEWWASVSPVVASKRCRAHNRKGTRCQRISIDGATVCYKHGGAASQVIAAAKARLANASPKMAGNLIDLAQHAKSEQVRLGATNSALEKAGVSQPHQVELGPMKPYEEIFEGISTESREESRARRGYMAPSVEDAEAESSGLSTEGDPPTHGAPLPPTQRNTRDQRSSAGSRVEGRDKRPRERSDAPARAGEDSELAAVYLARLANERSGALPAQRAIETRHAKYRAHRRSIY